MKEKIMNSRKRKIFSGLIVLVFVVLGACFWDNGTATVLAAEEPYFYVKQLDISQYRTDYIIDSQMNGKQRTYSKYPMLTVDDNNNTKVTNNNDEKGTNYQDWIFAGWFYDEACTQQLNLYETSGTYYAKFVPSDILSIRCQIESDVTADTSKANLRLVSSIDSDRYRDVGFVVRRGSTEKRYVSNNAYKRINAASEKGNDVAYSPQALHEDSEYFFTFSLTNIGNKNFRTPFYLCPFWRTGDGTLVYGESRYACVEDGYLHIVNVPVRLNTDMMATGGNFTVDYSCDETDFKYIGYQKNSNEQKEIFANIVADDPVNKKVTITVSSDDAVKTEGLVANLRFQLNQGTILSETTFKITEEKFNINGQETTLNISDFVFRNFPTKYSGGYDITWYDDPEEDTFGIASAADLYGLAALVDGTAEGFDEPIDFTGKTVYVVADIKVNEGTPDEWATKLKDADEKNDPHNWTSIGEEHNGTIFNGIFDGQGHTISGIYLNTANYSIGLFGQTTGTLKDFRLTDSKFINTHSKQQAVCVGSVVGYCFGEGEIDSVYSNAEIECGVGNECGGLVGRYGSVNDSTTIAKTISNSCFDGVINSQGRRVGGIVGRVYAGKKVITNCLNTGTINNDCSYSTHPLVAGLVGAVTVDGNALDKTILDLRDCINAGIISAPNAVGGVSATVAHVEGKKDVNDKYIKETAVLNMENVYMLHESHSKAGAINDGTINGIIYRLQDEYLTDKNAVSWTLLDFESAWAAKADKIPMPKALVSEKEQLDITGISQPDITWYNTEENDYNIENAADLCGLALLSTYYNFSGKTIKVTQDIEMSENVHWLPIGRIVEFAGTFGGASKNQIPTISGINLTTEKTYVGLFGNTKGESLIRNIRLTNSDFESRYPNEGVAYVGSIVGFCAGDIDTVYSSAKITSGAGYDCGGLVGRYGSISENKSITNSWFDGSIVSEGRRIGGIVGNVHLGSKTIENCLNTGTITSTYKTPNAEGSIIPFVAGLVGTVSNNEDAKDDITTLNLKDSVNSGKVIAEQAYTGASSIVSRVVGEENATDDYKRETAVLNLHNVFMLDDTHDRDISIKSDGTITGLTMILNNRYISGKNAVAWTTLDFVNDWAARADNVPAPKAFVTDELTVTGIKQPDITWYDENKTSYGIKNSQELSGFALISTNCEFYDSVTKKPKTVNVINDIEWEMDEEIPWLPIGQGVPFKGTFDGEYDDGKAAIISKIHITTDMQYVGLFGRCSEGSTIQNIGLKDSTFVSTYKGNIDGGDDDIVYMGSIAGYSLANLNNVYSNAEVIGCAMDIGGLVGRVNNTVTKTVGAGETQTTSNLTTRTFENCWFDGSVKSDEQRVGGFIGELTQGSMEMTNCLFTGTINSTFEDDIQYKEENGETIVDEDNSRIQTRAGGLCGFLQNQHTKLTVTDCIVTGEIIDSNHKHGVGAVFGRSTPNEGFTFDDVYITPGATYGSIETYIEDEYGNRIDKKTPVTGTADEVQDCDRLVGYIDYLNNAGLDFDNTWTLRTTGVPALKMFVPSEEIYTFDVNQINNNTLRLNYWPLSLKDAEDMGVSNYVLTYSGHVSSTTTYTQSLLQYYNEYDSRLLEQAGFTKQVENSIGVGNSKGVYNSVYTKNDGGMNWVITVTHADRNAFGGEDTVTGPKNETYISITTGKTAEEALSPHMFNTNPISYAATDGYTTSNQPVKLHMRETWFTGSSFVIQLPNGHFIINDGGSKHEFKYLIEDLYKWTGGDIKKGTKKPIIEAWTISHLHYAQSNVLSEFLSNPEYADKIYVEAVYLNEPSHDAMDLETDAETGLNDIYSCVRDEREGVKQLKTTKGERTKIYRYQTGQRFYFDAVTMDVVLAQEQIPVSVYSTFNEDDANYNLPELHGKFNTTSTGLMFTIDCGTGGEKKVYIGGDQTKVNMDWIMESYDAALFNDVNVFVTLQRGTNSDEEFAAWCTTKTDGTKHAFDYLLSSEQRATMNTQSNCFKGEGTQVYTYNAGTVTLTFNSNGTITSETAGARTNEEWTYHLDEERPN